MSVIPVGPLFPTFFSASGHVLDGGYIYIGQKGFEARTTPKASFFDPNKTIPTGTASGAAIRTAYGFPVRNGTPAVIYVDGDYSITVTDKAGVMVYSSLDAAALQQAKAESANHTAVTTTSALAALDVTQFTSAKTADGQDWLYTTGNFSTQITALDTRYVAPLSAPTGASGAWVRAGAVNTNFQPGAWGALAGSLYNGAYGHSWVRTGGLGTYGLGILQLRTTAATPAGQIDVASTAWNTHTNLTGGQNFAGWDASNSPRQGQTFTSGSVIGREINVGNRWGSQGLKSDIGGTRDFVALKIVPDVGPTDDALHYEPITAITIAAPGVLTRVGHGYYNGMRLRIYALTGTLPGGLTNGAQYFVVNATADTFQLATTFGGTGVTTTGTFAAGVAVLPSFPADFALDVGQSIWGHQFWTGFLTSIDSIVAGGVAQRLRGGSTAARAPGNASVFEGFFTTGLNTSLGTFVNNNAIFLGAGQNVRWTGDARINSTAGTMGITTGSADADGGLYADNFGQAAILWDGTGGVSRIGLNGSVPVAKGTITGAKGGNAALASLLAYLASRGDITDSTGA